MTVLSTPDERFENLPDYHFKPNYLQTKDGLKMHYVDEGTGSTVLMLHGEPSWSFLYRKMITHLSSNGFRAVAPDLIGFGKSDKPTERTDYSYQKHIDWLKDFIEKLDLQDIMLFCQDWGGLTGLRIITEMDERFSMSIASNTTLPTGNITMPESFMQWREFSQNSPAFDIGKVLDMGTVQSLSEEVIAAYNAPFPSEEYKAGARMFPTLVPVEFDDPESAKNRAAWEKLAQWKKPFLTIFGTHDNIMKGAEKVFQQIVPGAKGENHHFLEAGHFIQEEKGEELAQAIVAFHQKHH